VSNMAISGISFGIGISISFTLADVVSNSSVSGNCDWSDWGNGSDWGNSMAYNVSNNSGGGMDLGCCLRAVLGNHILALLDVCGVDDSISLSVASLFSHGVALLFWYMVSDSVADLLGDGVASLFGDSVASLAHGNIVLGVTVCLSYWSNGYCRVSVMTVMTVAMTVATAVSIAMTVSTPVVSVGVGIWVGVGITFD